MELKFNPNRLVLRNYFTRMALIDMYSEILKLHELKTSKT